MRARWPRTRWSRCGLPRRQPSFDAAPAFVARSFSSPWWRVQSLQASHAVYYGFSALQWHGAGLDGTAIAALWALGVLAEIVLFAVSGRLPFLQPIALLMIGAVGGAVRLTAMAFNPPDAALPFLQLLHAASYGATHLGALGFVARHAPHGQSATAQGYLSIAQGAAWRATGVSGWLYGAFGARLRGDGASGGRWRRCRLWRTGRARSGERRWVRSGAGPADRSSPRCR